jgi:hypothetical protein
VRRAEDGYGSMAEEGERCVCEYSRGRGIRAGQRKEHVIRTEEGLWDRNDKGKWE